MTYDVRAHAYADHESTRALDIVSTWFDAHRIDHHPNRP
jgi:hypothetical protein